MTSSAAPPSGPLRTCSITPAAEEVSGAKGPQKTGTASATGLLLKDSSTLPPEPAPAVVAYREPIIRWSSEPSEWPTPKSGSAS